MLPISDLGEEGGALRGVVDAHEVVPRGRLVELQLEESPGIGLAVGEEALGHRVHVLLAHLLGHVAVVGQQELVVEPEKTFLVVQDDKLCLGPQGKRQKDFVPVAEDWHFG